MARAAARASVSAVRDMANGRAARGFVPFAVRPQAAPAALATATPQGGPP
jgi:hypothetical protein